jgi:fatty acid desaturase
MTTKSLTVVNNRDGVRKLITIILSFAASLLLARAAWDGRYHAISGITFLIGAILTSVWTQHAIAEEIHDGVHLRVLSNARKNDGLCSIYSSILGISFAAFRREHLLHHKFFGTPEDPDYVKYAKAPKGLWSWVRYFSSHFSGWSAVQRLISTTLSKGIVRPSNGSSRQHPYGTCVAQICILGIGVIIVHPAWYFVCWIGPLFTITYGITQFRTMLEHWSPVEWASPKTGERRAGALFNLEGGLQRNLFAAQFGYNYHGSHHLLPTVPNTKLKNAAKDIADLRSNSGPPIHTMTYFARIAEICRRQR